MILGALIDTGVDAEIIRAALNQLPVTGINLDVEKVDKTGILATKARITVHGSEQDLAADQVPYHDHSDRAEHAHDHHHNHGHPHEYAHDHNHEHQHEHAGHDHDHSHSHDGHNHHHQHRKLADIQNLLAESSLDEDVKAGAGRIFERIAAAEAKIHGSTPEEIHFHEVGALDAVADVVGAVVGLRALGVDTIVCSPLPAATGRARMAHGIFPLPAPAALELCKGFVLRPDPATSELVTPTGAGIITTMARPETFWPRMILERIGYGAGTRDLPERPNVLRLVVGSSPEATAEVGPARDEVGGSADEVVDVIAANIDDMNPELYEYVCDKLYETGALDVTMIPAYMKANRPGTVVNIIAPVAKTKQLAQILMEETTTLGVRTWRTVRFVAQRDQIEVDTPYGVVRVKRGFSNGNIINIAPEYSDCRQAAEASAVPLKEVYAAALEAARKM